MESTPQTGQFPKEQPRGDQALRPAPDQPGRQAEAGARQTPASGVASACQPWRERLDELGLKPGCAYVYRVNGQLYAWGDFTHCPAEDITRNIRTLAEWLRMEPRRWGIGKSYYADVYRLEKAGDWDRVRREVREVYKERLHLIGEDGSFTPVEEHEEQLGRRHDMEQQANPETRKNRHTPTVNQPAADGALSLLWDGLPPAVAEKLAQPLDPALVSYRKGRSGRFFAYVEGHAGIAQANRIFG